MMWRMNLALPDSIKRLIEERVRSGRYDSPEEVVAAAVTQLDQQDQAATFPPGTLDAAIAEGEVDIAKGDVLDLDDVFDQLRTISARRRTVKR
jgi:putative addiction module CopG family antidote